MSRPTPEQIEAADPARSAWVSANAGSGKTRVLTQRVARLLLAGSRPECILCLTYTKAAAAEMQNRLFGMLGGWAMASDERLGAELAALEGRNAPERDAARLADARRLFARALEAPGGLRIQTIHAFCDALLRRFPLEAGVSPRFAVMDEREEASLVARVTREMADDAATGRDDAFDRAAERLDEGGIEALIRAVRAERAAFEGAALEPRLEALLGEAARLSPREAAARSLAGLGADALAFQAEQFRRYGGKTEQAIAGAIDAALATREADPEGAVAALAAAVLTKGGAPRKGLPTKKLLAAEPRAGEWIERLAGWALEAVDRRSAVETAARARDLDRFARALLDRYARAKAARGLLDFHDLVHRARDLLTRADMAAWVLFKLDRGIDHVLVDEAQDTSPEQWQVIQAITEEFHAGMSARPGPRTLFVVGDVKQSI